MLSSCLAENTIVDWIEGRLALTAHLSAKVHIDACSSCRAAVAELVKLNRASAFSDHTESVRTPLHESAWEPPPSFEDYRILRFIGQGQMGRVYAAHDVQLDRLVAIKFIRTLDADRSIPQRFRTEARAIARLVHPGVVQVFRAGELTGRPYLVSEFVDGQSLDRCPKPIPWQDVRRIGVALANALGAAHRRGVLHRDVKPANVMLTANGEPKLLDFGLAKLLDAPNPFSPEVERMMLAVEPAMSGVVITRTGAVVGTPRYLAPEIWEGEAASASSDVYSLGALLFELCTGQPPHPEGTMEALARSLREREPDSLLERVSGIDAGFACTIARCLHKIPSRRFADGEALTAALQEVIPSHSTDTSGSLSRRSPRRVLKWALGCIAICAVTTGGLLQLGHRGTWGRSKRVQSRMKGPNDKPVVAVLPFDDLSGTEVGRAIATGLRELVQNELALGGKLVILPATASGGTEPEVGDVTTEYALRRIQEVADRAGADHVIFASFHLNGEKGKRELEVDYGLYSSDRPLQRWHDNAHERGVVLFSRKLVRRLRGPLGLPPGIVEPADAQASLPIHPKAISLYLKGYGEMRQTRPLSARSLLEEALRIEPNSPVLHRQLGEIWMALGNDTYHQREAQLAFELAKQYSAELRPEEFDQLAAFFHQSFRRCEDAVVLLRPLAKYIQDVPEYASNFIEALLCANLPDKALEEWVQATQQIADFRNSPIAADVRGRIAIYMGDPKGALPYFEQSARMHERIGLPYWVASSKLHLTWALTPLGRYAEAAALLGEAIPRFRELGTMRDLAAALDAQAQLHTSLGETDRALSAVTESAQVWKDMGSWAFALKAELLRGKLLAAMGRWAEARSRSLEAIKLAKKAEDPEYEMIAMRLPPLIELLAGNAVEAERRYRASLAGVPKDRRDVSDRLLLGLGRAVALQGRIAEGRRYLTQALRNAEARRDSPLIPKLNVALSWLSLESHQDKEARQYGRTALASFGPHWEPEELQEARATVARSLAADGEVKEAQDLLASARKAAEHSENTLLRLKVALADSTLRVAGGQAGQAAEARAILVAAHAEADRLGFSGEALALKRALCRLPDQDVHTYQACQKELRRQAREHELRLFTL